MSTDEEPLSSPDFSIKDSTAVMVSDVGSGVPEGRPRLLRRRSTFVVEDEDGNPLQGLPRRQEDLLSSTIHTGGIKAILQRANRNFILPSEVQQYISSHFRMIKDENEFLNESLEAKTEQLDQIAREHQDCHHKRKELSRLKDTMKQLSTQLDRERAKSRAMVKQLKDSRHQDSDGSVVWFGLNNRVKDTSDKTQTGFVVPIDDPSITTITELPEVESISDDKKRLKQMKSQVQNLKSDVKRMKEVLHRELGSSALVEAALRKKSSRKITWEGREEQIKRLEEEVGNLKAALTSRGDELERSASGDSSNSSYKIQCQVAEVESQRLREYVRVVTDRLARLEENSAMAESLLREERRKSAKLEQLLEKSNLSSSSSSQQLLRMSTTSSPSDELRQIQDEKEALAKELEDCRQKRREDREMYLQMLSDTRKMIKRGGVEPESST